MKTNVLKYSLIILFASISIGCGTQSSFLYEDFGEVSEDGIVFDFIENAKEAVWHNNNDVVEINEEIESKNGVVKIVEGETGKTLILLPKHTEDGYIHGAYQLTFPKDSKFVFSAKAYLSDVEDSDSIYLLNLYILEENDLKPLAQIELTQDSFSEAVEVDINEFQGETRVLILGIDKESKIIDQKTTNISEARIVSKLN